MWNVNKPHCSSHIPHPHSTASEVQPHAQLNRPREIGLVCGRAGRSEGAAAKIGVEPRRIVILAVEQVEYLEARLGVHAPAKTERACDAHVDAEHGIPAQGVTRDALAVRDSERLASWREARIH